MDLSSIKEEELEVEKFDNLDESHSKVFKAPNCF